jgi:type I restriction-modification system DNA methylase subunit
MGTLFEELVRKCNEENNEEAGEHWTPRDAVKEMSAMGQYRPRYMGSASLFGPQEYSAHRALHGAVPDTV